MPHRRCCTMVQSTKPTALRRSEIIFHIGHRLCWPSSELYHVRMYLFPRTLTASNQAQIHATPSRAHIIPEEQVFTAESKQNAHYTQITWGLGLKKMQKTELNNHLCRSEHIISIFKYPRWSSWLRTKLWTQELMRNYGMKQKEIGEEFGTRGLEKYYGM